MLFQVIGSISEENRILWVDESEVSNPNIIDIVDMKHVLRESGEMRGGGLVANESEIFSGDELESEFCVEVEELSEMGLVVRIGEAGRHENDQVPGRRDGRRRSSLEVH